MSLCQCRPQWSPQWKSATRWLARFATPWLRRSPARCARKLLSPLHQSTVEHHVAPVVVEARVPAVAVHGHGLTKVESTLHGASRHGAGANYEYGDAHSFVSRRTG